MSVTLFEAGAHGFHTFRIPALVATGDGVLAFAEGRRGSASDSGWIETVVRRSDDGGRTWSPLAIVAGGQGVTGNPCPVRDRRTGRIVLTLCRNAADGPESDILMGRAARSVWVCHSDDDGRNWSALRDISADVKRPEWTWYATGPGHGVQLESGRLVVPCDHALHPDAVGVDAQRALELADSLYRSHVIVSDDGGASWRIGGVVDVAGTNESCVATLGGERLYLNSRFHGSRVRHGAWSEDGGETWPLVAPHPEMPDPVCQGSAWVRGGALLLCHVEGPGRRGLTLRTSSDGGSSWSQRARVCEGPAAYSDLCDVGGRLLCLFETGREHPYERIDLVELA